jgi:hypothetical protein
MPKGQPSGSKSTWKTFLANHAKQIAAIDFFTIPTLTFRNLYCFIILLHDRRQVTHFNVTAHPTAEWTARQLIEAFPEDRGAALLAQGSRSNLRGRISTASKGNGD